MGKAAVDTTTERNMRLHQRSRVRTEVEVNGGDPYCGGMLHDFSYSGASIAYQQETDTTTNPLEVGQTLLLVLNGKVNFPARIVRIFEGGFATKFDFSMSAPNA